MQPRLFLFLCSNVSFPTRHQSSTYTTETQIAYRNICNEHIMHRSYTHSLWAQGSSEDAAGVLHNAGVLHKMCEWGKGDSPAVCSSCCFCLCSVSPSPSPSIGIKRKRSKYNGASAKEVVRFFHAVCLFNFFLFIYLFILLNLSLYLSLPVSFSQPSFLRTPLITAACVSLSISSALC